MSARAVRLGRGPEGRPVLVREEVGGSKARSTSQRRPAESRGNSNKTESKDPDQDAVPPKRTEGYARDSNSR